MPRGRPDARGAPRAQRATGGRPGPGILVADAGFGKTTALEQALTHRGGPTVWLRTARGDGDPGRLVGRLVDAIRLAVPGVAEDYAERFAGTLEPLDAEDQARGLVEDIERLLFEPLVVAIDDGRDRSVSRRVRLRR